MENFLWNQIMYGSNNLEPKLKKKLRIDKDHVGVIEDSLELFLA